MTTRLLGAALTAAMLIVASAPAHADIIVLRNGKKIPDKDSIADLKPGEVPSLSQLQDSGKSNLTLTYNRVKIGSREVSAALVVDVFTTDAARNSDFNDGETYAASGDFASAAHKFGLAAQELSDADKQVALYKRMLTLRALGDLKPMLAAADDLIKADAQGYYVPEAHMLRARIFSSQGKGKEARAALDAITTATGMNARDYFEAEIVKLDWFSLRAAGTDAAKLEALEKKYRDVARQAGAKPDAQVQELKALVGAGKCLIRVQKYDEARKTFERITDDTTVTDKTLLGAAYHGLGDSVYGQSKADLKAAGQDQAKIDAAKAALTEAALHYLRVTEFYGTDWAADNVLDCTMNLARVFANQWVLDGSKDCTLGGRAYRYYVQAARGMPRGETRTQLVREALAFKKELDVACPPK